MLTTAFPQAISPIWPPSSSLSRKYTRRGHVEVRKYLLSWMEYPLNPLPTPGISFKTQALYVTVFVTRYLDLFTRYISFYNTVMKIFFIASSCYILYLMKFRFRCAPLPALTTDAPLTSPPPPAQRRTRPSTPSGSNTSSARAPCSRSSSTTRSPRT